MRELERVIGAYFKCLAQESKRYAQLRGLSVSVKATGVLRKSLLAIYLGFCAWMVLSASIFMVLVYGIGRGSSARPFYFDRFSAAASALGLIAAVFLAWAFRESTWLSLLGFKRRIRELCPPTQSPQPAREEAAPNQQNGLSAQEIMRMLEERLGAELERKLTEKMDEKIERKLRQKLNPKPEGKAEAPQVGSAPFDPKNSTLH